MLSQTGHEFESAKVNNYLLAVTLPLLFFYSIFYFVCQHFTTPAKSRRFSAFKLQKTAFFHPAKAKANIIPTAPFGAPLKYVSLPHL